MLRRAIGVLRALYRPFAAAQSPLEEPDQAELGALRDQLNLMLYRQIEFQREARLLLGQATLPRPGTWAPSTSAGSGLVEGPIFTHSTICRQESFETPYYPHWMAKVGYAPRYHRKLWEFAFICQVLWERSQIRPGARGLGFGVGGEPLTAFFASEGCVITATDMAPEAAAAAGWTETAQHAAGKEELRRPGLCPDALFDANVTFQTCDMNAIPQDMTGYDFCWSACALEHLGSIELGLRFIENSLDTLKPGGFAIHTTEFNLSSNDDTLSEGGTVLFRQRDMEELSRRLAAKGHTMAPLDLDPGQGRLDQYIDVAPYRIEPHLRLALAGYCATSIGLIIQKAG